MGLIDFEFKRPVANLNEIRTDQTAKQDFLIYSSQLNPAAQNERTDDTIIGFKLKNIFLSGRLMYREEWIFSAALQDSLNLF